ncbi:Pkinase-domain-containing protein [Fomes fomentarius]|nr:Pkinase-domain-containing protein [Fomes fomentarius]
MHTSEILPNFTGITISRCAFHLRLLEKIGSGAYGVVYLAEDVSFNPQGPSHYAVKCLLRHPSDSDFAYYQQREFDNHTLVSDLPNVVSLHAIIEEEFYTFVVLDLCPGGDLFTAIMEGTYMHNTSAIKHTFLQIIDALEACHEKGVYHRDLKPENILCSADGSQVFLADFGLSTRSRRSPEFGCGSSSYKSPECVPIYRNKQPYETKASDGWALGIVLCNLITGRSPWHIASPREDMGFSMYMQEGAVWLYKNMDISLGAAAILGRIFDLNPDTRITLPELRHAILGLDTFHREDVPAVTAACYDAAMTYADVQESQDDDIADVSRLGQQDGSWELQPIALSTTFSTDFMTMAVEDISAAASATLAGTASTSVNQEIRAPSSDAVLKETWSITPLAPHASSRGWSEPSNIASETWSTTPLAPRGWCESSDAGSSSSGPITPEAYAADPVGPVPEFELDFWDPTQTPATQVPEEDITLALTRRLAELKHEKAGQKRRGSLSRILEGMKKVRVLL